MTVVDLFAGPGGWDKGAESLGIRPVGVELDEWACATRAAAGLLTIRADVTTLDPASFGDVEGLIASPPCPDFSMAGKKAGIEGETGRLMWEVPRWAVALRPKWIACEQVPPALEWWESFARDLEHVGYKTWTGILCAANYGTPQTRTRAFLLARLDRPVHPPDPTHARHPQPDLSGNVAARWVSMAEALGWGMTARPALTITAKDKGGVALAPGGSGARRILRREQDEGRVMLDRRQNGAPVVDVSENPCPTITGAMFGKGVAKVWAEDRPATTVMGDPRIFPPDGHHGYQLEAEGLTSFSQKAIRVTIPELGILQDFPPDYPWQGNKSQQSRQVGNAVPVRLARAVLEAVTK